MTPSQKIKWLILLKAIDWHDIKVDVEIKEENIDEIYDFHDFDHGLQDAKNEVRSGEIYTNISSSAHSRYYESRSVAAKLPDDSWVGWNYWYGGGKHSEPESIPWIEYAYELDCKEEEKLVIVREFTKKSV